MLAPWKKSYDQLREHIKKQRHYFANKAPSSQSYGFSSSHVWMWELEYKESWAQKNWCFWIVKLEKALESPLDCKEIQPVHPKGDQSWVFIGRTDAEAETPMLWLLDEKSWLILMLCWQRLRAEGEGDDRGWDGWMAPPTQGHEFKQALGVVDGQGGLVCCSPWCHKELDTTERLNWTEGQWGLFVIQSQRSQRGRDGSFQAPVQSLEDRGQGVMPSRGCRITALRKNRL